MALVLISWDQSLEATDLSEQRRQQYLVAALRCRLYLGTPLRLSCSASELCSLPRDDTSEEWSISCGESKDTGRRTWSTGFSCPSPGVDLASGSLPFLTSAREGGIREKLDVLGDGEDKG